MSRKKRRKRRRTGHRLFYIFVSCLLVIAAMVAVSGIAAAGMYGSGKASLRKSAEGNIPLMEAADETQELAARKKAQLATVPWQDSWVVLDGKVYEYNEDILNLLFLGIDRSGGISGETRLDNWEAGQADAIFVLSLNPAEKTVKIIGIPRNSMVELDIFDEQGNCVETIYNQICLQYGYAGGGENGLVQMSRAVSDLLYGLPMHGVFAIGYDAVAVVNDKLGGVTVTVLEDMQEVNPAFVQGSRIHLTGRNVLQYVKWRDVTRLGSPTKRLERQKQYIMALFQTGKQRIKEQPLIVTDLYNMVSPYMNTDVSLNEAVYLAAEAMNYRFDDHSFYLLSGKDKAVVFTKNDGTEDFYDDYYLDEESIRQTMKDAFYTEVRLEGKQSGESDTPPQAAGR